MSARPALRPFLCLLAAAALAGADHPRLLFSAADIPGLRARITTAPWQGMYERLLATWDSGDWGMGSQVPPSDYDECANMINAGFLYVLTGDDVWAQRSLALALNRVNDATKWANTGYKGLGLYMHGKSVALAYDFCHGAPSWAADRALISQKLLAQADVIYTNGGTGQNGSSASNWQGNRYSAGGLCYLATDEAVPAANVDGCFTKVNLYNTANMGTGAGNRGWNIEGLGYTFYPWGNFVGPYGIAAMRLRGQDIRAATPSAVDHTLWGTFAATCLIRNGATPHLLRPDFGDDNPGNTHEGSAGLAFHYCPPALRPGLVWWYQRTVGAAGLATYDNARGGLMYSILFHPGAAVPEADPMTIPEWRAAFVDTEGNGYQTFRNRYQDADDLVAQLYVKRRGNAGHNGPDALGLRILGLDSAWAVGGGRYGPKINNQDAYLRSQNSLYPVDPDATLTLNGNSGVLLGTPVVGADGSGTAAMSIGTSNVNVRNHTRRFLADYSAASGAAAVYVVSDTSDDGRWWQLCTLPANTVVTAADGFTITSPTGASLKATIVHPASSVITAGTRIRGSGYGYKGVTYDSNAFVHAQSADGDYLVVMTIVPPGGSHPAVSALAGSGANSGRVLGVGGLTVSVNGDAIGVLPGGFNAPPTVASAAHAAAGTITGTSVALDVLGADDDGEAALAYSWSTLSGPGVAAFSPNGNNAARNAIATFPAAGSYTLRATISDAAGQTVASDVGVQVIQTQSGLAVTPASASVARSATRQFTAAAVDQFGVPMAPQPAFTWAVSGGGGIDAGGLFTAGTTLGGPFTVTAQGGGLSGTASVSVVNIAPTVVNPATCTTAQPVTVKTAALTALGADDLAESGLKYDWSTVGTPPASVSFSPDNSNAAKNTTATFSQPGIYDLQVRIYDASNAAVTSAVTVVVERAANKVAVSPATADIVRGASRQYAGSVVDQFGATWHTQPASFTWAVSGGGTIDGTGLFTAGATATAASYTVTAGGGGVSGTAIAKVVNQAPTLVNAAACTTAQPIAGKTAVLTALGADDLGEAGLKYDWSTTGTPPAAVSFSPDNTNAAKSTTATFAKIGTYVLRCTIKDASNASVVTDVTVNVGATLTSVLVSPTGPSVEVDGGRAFSALALDQFAAAMASQPGFAWAVSGGGAIDPVSGLFTAGAVAGGPHTVTATGGGRSGTAKLTVIAAGLPAGWQDLDVGAPTTTGNAAFASATGTFTVKGAGSDIAGSADQFHYAFQSLTGDGEIIARVASVQNTNSNAKAGVMLRASAGTNVLHALMAITPSGGAQFIRRTTAGSNSSSTSQTGVTAPRWVKLVRSGSSVSGFISSDGIAWTQVGTNQTIAFGATISVGLAVSSKSTGTLCTGLFDNVQVVTVGGG